MIMPVGSYAIPHSRSLTTVQALDIAAVGGAGSLPLRVPSMDHALAGGLPFGAVSELLGPAGSGKTQAGAPDSQMDSRLHS